MNMKTSIKLWTIYAALILALVFTLECTGQSNVIINEIEYAEDVPPTVTIMVDWDIEKVAKASAAQVQSRQHSIVAIAQSMYVISYVNKEYIATLWHRDDRSWQQIWEAVNAYEPAQDANIIFRSTKVTEVRKWLTDELVIFYEADISAW